MSKKLKWSTKKCDAAQEYIWLIRDHMRLTFWDVYLSDTATEKGNWADVTVTEGKHSAAIRLCSQFWDLTPEQRRETIVHEMLHVVHWRAIDGIGNGWAKLVKEQEAFDAVWALTSTEVELMVDQLTAIIAPHMPLPPKLS